MWRYRVESESALVTPGRGVSRKRSPKGAIEPIAPPHCTQAAKLVVSQFTVVAIDVVYL